MKSEKSAFCEINVHGRLLAANQKFCSLFGYKAQEVYSGHLPIQQRLDGIHP